jgi:hypothetical protein
VSTWKNDKPRLQEDWRPCPAHGRGSVYEPRTQEAVLVVTRDTTWRFCRRRRGEETAYFVRGVLRRFLWMRRGALGREWTQPYRGLTLWVSLT